MVGNNNVFVVCFVVVYTLLGYLIAFMCHIADKVIVIVNLDLLLISKLAII